MLSTGLLRRRLSSRLFHTQTVVHWRNEDEVECCQLLGFRHVAVNSKLQALTVNDTTRATAALRHLRSGNALVYTGGDYHNARQLLQAVKRKSTSGSQQRKKRAKEKKKCIQVVGSRSIQQQWMKQRQLQREQSELAHKLLIQVSVHDSRPSEIIGLQRVPANTKDIFSFAFQNDEEINVTGDDLSLSRPNYFLLSLNDFLAMIGSYEWNRKGVYIHALQDYIFPHFGVFPPTRQDYITLLDNICADRTQEKPIRMMEVGIGSGVLSIILLQQKKVDRVIGTDINPYAVACAKDNVHRFGFSDQVDIMQADMFPPTVSTINEKFDLVLFNPPWIPGNAATWLDSAVYDSSDQSLLRRFLLQVQHYVDEDGHVYLLLSNLGILLGLFQEQDLHKMFRDGNLDVVERFTTVMKKGPAKNMKDKSKKHQLEGIETARAEEVISLYHLRLKR